MLECLNVNEVISFSRFEHSNIQTFQHFSYIASKAVRPRSVKVKRFVCHTGSMC